MYIDEYIIHHPEKLPSNRELMEFAAECESYIGHAKDLVPYDDPNYVAKVFDICIAMCTPNPELDELCKYADEQIEN